MFDNNDASTLDLSSFDMSNVRTRVNMFYLSRATTGYARTQTGVDILNNTTGAPDALTFTVKN